MQKQILYEYLDFWFSSSVNSWIVCCRRLVNYIFDKLLY